MKNFIFRHDFQVHIPKKVLITVSAIVLNDLLSNLISQHYRSKIDSLRF